MQELLRELLGRSASPPKHIKPPECHQDGEELRARTHLLAQLVDPGVRLGHFWSRVALRCLQRLSESELKHEFLLGT